MSSIFKILLSTLLLTLGACESKISTNQQADAETPPKDTEEIKKAEKKASPIPETEAEQKPIEKTSLNEVEKPLEIEVLSTQLDMGSKITLTGSGGEQPYSFSVVSGGASIDTTTGELSVGFVKGSVVVKIEDASGASYDQVFDIQSKVVNLPLTSGGTIYQTDLSDDHAMYLADLDGSGTKQLYVTALDGSSQIRLNPDLVTGGNVTSAVFNFDKSKIIYRADLVLDEVFRVYSVNLDGSDNTEINDVLGADQSVLNYTISPTENKVIYLADQDTAGVIELYVVTIGSNTSSKLTTMEHANGDVQAWDFYITPNGLQVIYVADKTNEGIRNIYSVAITGGASTQLNDTLAGNDLYIAGIAPNSLMIVYIAEQDNTSRKEFYSATIGMAASSVRLHPGLPNGDCYSNDFVISKDSQRAIIHCSTMGFSGNSLVTLGTTNEYRFHESASGISFTEDSQYVTFATNEAASPRWDIYSIDVTNPAGTKTLIDTESYGVSAGIASSNQFIFAKTDGFYKATAGIVGSTRLTPEITSGGAVRKIFQTPSLSHVIYIADADEANKNELYSFKADGSEHKKLNGSFDNPEADVDTLPFKTYISPDGQKVLFRADGLLEAHTEMYVSGI